MPKGSSINKSDYAATGAVDQHIIALPKTQLAHNIIRKVTKPICHIPLPSFLSFSFASQNLTKLPNMQKHNPLHPLQRLFPKRLTQHPPLPPMHKLIDCIMRVPYSLNRWKSGVKISLPDLFSVAVDIV
jgi:hypothetical protein